MRKKLRLKVSRHTTQGLQETAQLLPDNSHTQAVWCICCGRDKVYNHGSFVRKKSGEGGLTGHRIQLAGHVRGQWLRGNLWIENTHLWDCVQTWQLEICQCLCMYEKEGCLVCWKLPSLLVLGFFCSQYPWARIPSDFRSQLIGWCHGRAVMSKMAS